jgi:hypothetical protein
MANSRLSRTPNRETNDNNTTTTNDNNTTTTNDNNTITTTRKTSNNNRTSRKDNIASQSIREASPSSNRDSSVHSKATTRFTETETEKIKSLFDNPIINLATRMKWYENRKGFTRENFEDWKSNNPVDAAYLANKYINFNYLSLGYIMRKYRLKDKENQALFKSLLDTDKKQHNSRWRHREEFSNNFITKDSSSNDEEEESERTTNLAQSHYEFNKREREPWHKITATATTSSKYRSKESSTEYDSEENLSNSRFSPKANKYITKPSQREPEMFHQQHNTIVKKKSTARPYIKEKKIKKIPERRSYESTGDNSDYERETFYRKKNKLQPTMKQFKATSKYQYVSSSEGEVSEIEITRRSIDKYHRNIRKANTRSRQAPIIIQAGAHPINTLKNDTTKVKEWFQHFEKHARFNEWDEETKGFKVSCFFAEKAQKCWEKMRFDQYEYDVIKQYMIKNFKEKDTDIKAGKTFYNSKQEQGESVEEYVKKMADAREQLPIDDETALKILIQGLDFNTSTFIELANPKTFKQAVKMAIDRGERNQNRNKESQYIAAIREKHDNCFNCGSPDHWARDCTINKNDHQCNCPGCPNNVLHQRQQKPIQPAIQQKSQQSDNKHFKQNYHQNVTPSNNNSNQSQRVNNNHVQGNYREQYPNYAMRQNGIVNTANNNPQSWNTTAHTSSNQHNRPRQNWDEYCQSKIKTDNQGKETATLTRGDQQSKSQ